MKKIVMGVSLVLASGLAIAGDHDFDGRIYATPSFTYVIPDSDKNAKAGIGVGIGLGKFFTKRISVDLEFSRVVLDKNNGDELTQNTLDLMGRYHFNEQMGIRPYLGLGVGFLRTQRPTEFNSTLSLAAGISKEINDRIRLRTEVRYRLENSDDRITGEDSFADYLFNAGLSIALGEASVQSTQTNLVDPAPQMDSDNDGVSDANDRCPNSPAGTKVDANGCAVAVDGDDDRDGVLNSVDQCPHSKAGAVVGRDGCEVKVVIELQGVHFDTDKSTLKPESIVILDAAVKTLGDHGSIRVEVAGHTDSTASDAYNQALSQRRAKVVYDYLSAHGIADDRMTWKGYGESQPIATNDTAEGRARNRRTELIVQ
jgi:OOP family OmpA-OmpF porin